MNEKTISVRRIAWIDIAKAYGIILVFYGHVVEVLADYGNTPAFLEFKFIYSFHMPLFFILCGYVSRNKDSDFSSFFKYHLTSRIVPVVFFNLLALSIKNIIAISSNSLDFANVKKDLLGLLFLLKGYPTFNFMTWFLICLFTVENIHFFLNQHLKKHKDLIIFSCIFFFLGWLITWKINFFQIITGIANNFWYVHESLIAYSFYLFGVLLKRLGFLENKKTLFREITYLVVTLLLVLLTFNLNTHLFTFRKPVVLMAVSSHGNPLLFLITALTGSLFVILLADLTPANRIILFIGQNTLILLGLSGLFYSFVNDKVLIGMKDFLPKSNLLIFGACSLVTLSSIIICIPFILILNKFLPQLVGKPRINGPIIKNLI
jgi:acyltransferase